MTPNNDQNTPLTTKTSEINHEIGKRLRALRTIRGKTQKDLGAILGVSYQQIQKYERGVSPIAAASLSRLAVYLKTDLNYFFYASAHPEDDITAAIDSLSNPDLRAGLLDLIGAIKKHPKESL